MILILMKFYIKFSGLWGDFMKKKDFLLDVMLFEMLKFVIDCKDFIIIVWWYVLVINKIWIC